VKNERTTLMQKPTEAQPDEAALLTQAMAGDLAARTRLIDRYYLEIQDYLRVVTRHPQDAEDLVQETCVKLLQRLNAGDPWRGSLRVWLYATARNVWRNHRRRIWGWAPVIPRDSDSDSDPDPSPVQQLETEDSRAAFWRRAREHLPARQFEALYLHTVKELSLEATAGVLGGSVNGARHLCERARLALHIANISEEDLP
jgi:RNA polymerase sigma factor (sigma-70 family)